MRDLAQKKLLLTQTAIDPFETGTSMMSIIGPWQFAYWQQKYPQLKLNKTYALAPPPVPDSYPAGQAIKTFADAKGIVIYKQASEAQQQAMWQFVKWVFSDPAHDLLWLQATGLPSARDDLSSNTAFKPYLDQHPELASFAQNIPNAVPPATTPKYTDIQVALGDDAVIPVVKGQMTPDEAWDSWKKAVQPLLS
jgi:multiple sugar transport system substrate-binding protein